jgi:demethylmenaquinone methyltransferase/2-methoxy-6-polyprenyl-1,4-benzoquinol methylase
MNKREFFDSLAPAWDRDGQEGEKESGQKFRDLAVALHLCRCDRVLDVGSGTGVLIPYLEEAVGASGEIIALDFSLAMLRTAKMKYPAGRVRFLQADAHHLCLREKTVDAVVCFSTFPHFDNQADVLREFRRVLKSGGYLSIVHFMSRAEINAFHARVDGPVRKDALPDHDDMARFLTRAGFRDISIEDRPSFYHVRAKA